MAVEGHRRRGGRGIGASTRSQLIRYESRERAGGSVVRNMKGFVIESSFYIATGYCGARVTEFSLFRLTFRNGKLILINTC